MDNIQILLGQFKAGMREHGIESSSWVVNRDVFAKIILSKYSELEPRSANRLYSSLDLKYTDQVSASAKSLHCCSATLYHFVSVALPICRWTSAVLSRALS